MGRGEMIYPSLLHPWSAPTHASAAEQLYRAAGLQRTKGTIFLLPPPPSVLVAAYTAPPRPRTRMSAGAVALCKHFERGGASSEHGRIHPYWDVPRGSNEAKTEIAGRVLERMLAEVVWRNVMLLHPGVAVYEVRNARGWGMRWSLEIVREDVDEGRGRGRDQGVGDGGREFDPDKDGDSGSREIVGGCESGPSEGEVGGEVGSTEEASEGANRDADADVDSRRWKIVNTTFRGFVEPIEGMDHEIGHDSGALS